MLPCFLVAMVVATAASQQTHPTGPGCPKAQIAPSTEWWEAPPFDPAALLFMTHIPFTGGSALSWHLQAVFRDTGRVYPGSQCSAGITWPMPNDPDASAAWGSGTRSPDGVTPRFQVAFGHNRGNDPRVEGYGGPLALATILSSPRNYQVHGASGWICPRLARRYTPWWPTDDKFSNPSLWQRSSNDTGLGRAEAPDEVKKYCKTGQWFATWRVDYRTPPRSTMQSDWIAGRPATDSHSGTTPVPCAAVSDNGRGANEQRINALYGNALKGLADMPWFGLLEHWGGSLCLLHHVTKWTWPFESRKACGVLVDSWDLRNFTKGPAALEQIMHMPTGGRAAEERDRVIHLQHSNSHKGSAPSLQNNYSTCPIWVAETLLQDSATHVMSSWLARDFQELSNAVYPLTKKELQNMEPSSIVGSTHSKNRRAQRRLGLIDNYDDPAPRYVLSPDDGEQITNDPNSPFADLKKDARGPDGTVHDWASAAFHRRMHAAAVVLAKQGYSSRNPPAHLSPDCFDRPAPDGFLVHQR